MVTGAVNRDLWSRGSFAKFVAGAVLCEPRGADFVAVTLTHTHPRFRPRTLVPETEELCLRWLRKGIASFYLVCASYSALPETGGILQEQLHSLTLSLSLSLLSLSLTHTHGRTPRHGTPRRATHAAPRHRAARRRTHSLTHHDLHLHHDLSGPSASTSLDFLHFKTSFGVSCHSFRVRRAM